LLSKDGPKNLIVSYIDQAPAPAALAGPLLVSLEQLETDVFANHYNQRNIKGSLFGGQILGQSAAAAMATVPGRALHSMHGYFLRAGSAAERVFFTVERIRDGGRFSTRRVVARQSGQIIFEMSSSFFDQQQGFEHQMPRTDVPPPEALDDLAAIVQAGGDGLPANLAYLATYPIEIKPVTTRENFLRSETPRLQFWTRIPSAATTDDPLLHQQMLAYLSDYWLAGAPLVMHRSPVADQNFMVASLDHAIWFHRPARVDDWLLYDTDSPSAHHGVNLSRGLIFDRAGMLVASVAQEMLQVKV
jgi:acyl-CoA thioesterase-2